MTHPARATVRTDRRLIRASGRSTRYLLVEISAPTIERDPNRRRPPVNLSFVVDRSGSMAAAGKLDLAKQAVEEALSRLEATDRFSIVVYDDRVDVLAATSAATEAARRRASAAMRPVAPGGSTNLSGGWLTGCEQVGTELLADGVNRCLLLTDGLANVGITEPDALAQHATELRGRGVSTTTFGVGADFDEVLLQQVADAGGGHFYFIGSLPEIRDHITGEVGEALEVVARKVELFTTTQESVEVEPLAPYPTGRRPGRTAIQLGDLVSGQTLRIVLRVTFPYGEVGREVGMLLALRDADGAFADLGPEALRVSWAYADHAANDRQERDGEVDRAVAEAFAARARQEAAALNRRGEFGAAQKALGGVARRIRDYAGSDPALLALVDELESEGHRFSAPMPAMALKQAHFAASNSLRSRSSSGGVVKGEPR